MKITRRLRISILAMMGIVAVVAMSLGWAVAERRKRVAALTAEMRRLEDHLSWAEKMRQRGYVSQSKLTAEQKSLTEVRIQLKSLGVPSEGP